MLNARGKYTAEVNSLTRRLKHAKKEQKEEAVAFELQLWKLWQELKDGENVWMEAEKKFSEKAVQMTTDLSKVKDEVEERSQESDQLKAGWLRRKRE